MINAHPLYHVWENMKARVLNPKHKSFFNYGGRGISICNEWMEFKPFYDWAKDKWARGLDLDRKDNDGNYEPGNCRFVTRSISTINQRIKQRNQSGYTGVSFIKERGLYKAYLSYKCMGGRFMLGCYTTPEAAVAARNSFIIKNNLPHKIQEIK